MRWALKFSTSIDGQSVAFRPTKSKTLSLYSRYVRRVTGGNGGKCLKHKHVMVVADSCTEQQQTNERMT